jgi:hypothetical protein
MRWPLRNSPTGLERLRARLDFRFGIIPVDFLLDDTIRNLVDVGPQGPVQFLEFRPHGFINKNPWSPNHDRRLPLPGVTIRLQTVPSQQAQQEPPGPQIRQRETNLNSLDLLLSHSQPFSNSLAGIFGGAAFARCRGSGIKPFDLMEFFDEVFFFHR